MHQLKLTRIPKYKAESPTIIKIQLLLRCQQGVMSQLLGQIIEVH